MEGKRIEMTWTEVWAACRRPLRWWLMLLPAWFGVAQAWDLGHGLSVDLALRGIGQHGVFSGPASRAGGAALLDVAPRWEPTPDDVVFLWARFAAGNGLNAHTPTVLAPYGGDLGDDVRGIDGTDRSYLLEGWVQRRIPMKGLGVFRLTLGIVDVARFIDENDYANDQDGQFMNQALVNVAKSVLPNYEPAAVLQWDRGPWSLRAAGVLGSLDNSMHLDYGAGELVYTAQTPWGEGHTRVLGFLSGPGHPAPDGRMHDRRIAAVALNMDQALGDTLGVFFRGQVQAERGDGVYRSMLSGGAVWSGRAWGRPSDRVGIGYAMLEGMDHTGLRGTQLVEVYWRWRLGKAVDWSLDLQWMRDDYRHGSDVEAWIGGLRANVVF